MALECQLWLNLVCVRTARRVILSLLAVLMLSPAVQAGGPVDVWIEMLSSERFVDRQRATVSLIKLGDQSIDSLLTAASEADAEVSRRAVDVLENLLNANDSAVAARASPEV